VVASTAVTTGLFVLAGVLVGGLVTGGVNYALERRRENASARVAMRLLEAELALAGARADDVIERGRWSAWNFKRAHRTWDEYRAQAASGLSGNEWVTVAIAFNRVEVVERGPGSTLMKEKRSLLRVIARCSKRQGEASTQVLTRFGGA
jgi:hypothetical protein